MAKKRIGVHVGTSGGCFTAVTRAVEAGANTFQIFSASPRQWKASPVKPEDAAKMQALRAEHDVNPVAIHASYLINLCSQTETVRANSIDAFRGEVERALDMGAEFLVLHPGSWKGLTREEGLKLAAQGIEKAIDGLKWQDRNFRILIENTAGAEFSLGGSFDQVAELVATLRACAPVDVCLDTCHCHVAGYDLVTPEGYEATMKLIGETVGFGSVREGRHGQQARPPRAHRRRHHRLGSVQAFAARCAFRPCLLYRRNPGGRARRRDAQRDGAASVVSGIEANCSTWNICFQ
jgi:deoxyribonuclease-4